MITLCIMPAFKGTVKETILATIQCLAIDTCIFLPMILSYHS
jgi:hypothetical protein